MDSPKQFLQDVIDADESYLYGFTPDLLVGNFRVTEFMGIPKEVPAPALQFMIDGAKDNGHRLAKNLRDIVENPPPCIEDQDTYNSLQYIVKVEAAWAKSLLEDTLLKNYTTLPEGLDTYMQELVNIPLCK